MDISVIIINWNTKDLLRNCLASLSHFENDLKAEIIVTDNASEDGSREMVSSDFPGVTLHVNSSNLGFGAGNNRALPLATGRYILFLNSDTIVNPLALEKMVRYADKNPDIGILGPKLLNEDGSLQYSCRRYPQIAMAFFRNTPLGRLFPNNKYTNNYLMQDWDHSEPRDVDWVSGAALMIRRDLLNQIGSFDEEYYMYCEDVDLCWRANNATSGELFTKKGVPSNWRVIYFPDAVIQHLIGKSSDQAPTRMTYEFHRSQYLFYKKHYSAATPLLIRPLIPLGIAIRAVGQMSKYRINYWKRRLFSSKKTIATSHTPNTTKTSVDNMEEATSDQNAISQETLN